MFKLGETSKKPDEVCKSSMQLKEKLRDGKWTNFVILILMNQAFPLSGNQVIYD